MVLKIEGAKRRKKSIGVEINSLLKLVEIVPAGPCYTVLGFDISPPPDGKSPAVLDLRVNRGRPRIGVVADAETKSSRLTLLMGPGDEIETNGKNGQIIKLRQTRRQR